VNPAVVWSLSLAFFFVPWVYLPAHRLFLSVVICVHLAVLVWGVGDVRSQFFGRVYWRNKRRKQAVALTFDDGPDPLLTPDLLDLLASYGYKATFFVIAEKARANPELVRQIRRQGHVVACHDLRHSVWSNFRRGNRLRRDIGEAISVIAGILEAKPLLYRPPAGLINPHLHPVLAGYGLRCVGWSRKAGEGGNRFAGRLHAIPGMAEGGQVLLLHDALPKPALKPKVLAAVRALLDAVRSKHLATETVDEFFSIPAYEQQRTRSA